MGDHQARIERIAQFPISYEKPLTEIFKEVLLGLQSDNRNLELFE